MSDTKYRIVEKTVEAEQPLKQETPRPSERAILWVIVAVIMIFLILALWAFGV